MSISIMGSWIATLAFFFVVFLVGKYLQNREKQEKMTKRATDAIRNEMVATAAAGAGAKGWESSTIFGTRYGSPTEFERRRSKG